jgi:hypothetical protein
MALGMPDRSFLPERAFPKQRLDRNITILNDTRKFLAVWPDEKPMNKWLGRANSAVGGVWFILA